MSVATEIKTVNDADGVPVLLIIKERNELLICESDNINRNIKLTGANTRTLVEILQSFR